MSPFRRQREQDLRDEIASHLRMAIEDRIARGMPPDQAAADARRELGNVSQIQEAARDVWGRRWMDALAQDLRYALRVFRRNRSFALVAIISLALGIGANAALFQVLDAVRLQSLPVADPSSLVEVRIVDMDGARGSFETWHPAVTYPIWREIQARQQAFSGVFAWGSDRFNLTSGGEVRAAQGLWVTGDAFTVLGVRPVLGRMLTADDDRAGCAPRAVLSHAFWQRAYGGSPLVIGQALTLSAHPVEIVGVAPAEFHGLEVGRTFDVAMPVCADPVFSDDGKGRLPVGTEWWLSVFGRLKPGWSLERARAHLQAISPELFRTTLPATYPSESVTKYLGFKLGAYEGGSGISHLRETYASPLWLLLGTSGLVLVIACANLANLLLARATSRQREIAVRLSLGAGRGRLVRQLLTESVLLALIGGVLGLLLAHTLSGFLVALLDTQSESTSLPLGLDWRVLGFTAGLSLLTCILFGLAPAMNATRVSASTIMRATVRSATSSRDVLGLRRVLVVAQIALSVVLLFGSLLFARTLHYLMTADPGFNPKGVVIAGITFRQLDLSADRRASFRRELVDRVRALPGVQAAAAVRIVPLSGNGIGNDVWPEGDRPREFSSLFNMAGAGYFAAIGTPLVAGRDFDDRDTPRSTPVAVVSEAFAQKLLPGRSVVGARFTRQATPSSPETTFEIIGVVKNSMYTDLKEDLAPVAFLADAQSSPIAYMAMIVRSPLPAGTVTAAITRTLAGVDPRIGVTYSVMTTDIRDTLLRERLLATLSGAFGALAAILTLVGLYGLVAYTVARRTNEIGIRMALGARASDVARLIVHETGMLLSIGIVAGVVLALAGGRAAASLLFGVRPHDPLTLLGAVAGLAVIAFGASYLPARRATKIEPVAALRVD
jgi:putative ABC transport system permease protein